MPHPTVTVGILAHNGERYLHETLAAVRQLAYADIEVIVLDNASTDGTRRVLSQWPDVVALHEPVNLGCGGGRNRLLGAARGDYVLLLDDDVVLDDPETIQTFVDESRRRGDACVLSAVLAERDAPVTMHYGLFFAPLKRPVSPDVLRTLPAFRAAAPIDGCTFFHRGVASEIGAYDARYPFNLSDYDFGARTAVRGIPTWILTGTHGVHTGGARRVDPRTWEWRQSFYLCGMVRTLAKVCRWRDAAIWIPGAMLWVAWRLIREAPRFGPRRVTRALVWSLARAAADVPSTLRERRDARRPPVIDDRFLMLMPPVPCQNGLARTIRRVHDATCSALDRVHGVPVRDPRHGRFVRRWRNRADNHS
jgi:GT2 family glycosyltransferase